MTSSSKARRRAAAENPSTSSSRHPPPSVQASSRRPPLSQIPGSAIACDPMKKKRKQPQQKPKPPSSSSEEEDDLPPSSATQKKEQTVEHECDSDGSDSDRPIAPEPKSKPAVKRAIVLALSAEDSRRSKKRKIAEGGSVEEEEGKKTASLFQRLWSDDDEIAILKGMLDYEEEKGANPSADYPAFLDFIKDSLHVEVETKQLVDKIRRLKKRYKNSLVKKKKSFSPHEQTAFDLSSRIWGDNEDDQKSNVKTRIVSKAKAEAGSAAAPLSGSSEGESWQFIGKACISMGLDDITVKAGLELCSQEMKAELEEKWKQLYRDESELFLKKLDLAIQESSMITEALKKGK